jgi:hypothetical protein
MADGHLSKCKTCTRYDVRARRRENIEHYREYDRQRYRDDPARRENMKRQTVKEHEHHPYRKALRTRTQRLAGAPPPECEVCGLPNERLEKHHHDYSRADLWLWVCKPCHAIADKLRRLIEAKAS